MACRLEVVSCAFLRLAFLEKEMNNKIKVGR